MPLYCLLGGNIFTIILYLFYVRIISVVELNYNLMSHCIINNNLSVLNEVVNGKVIQLHGQEYLKML